MEEWRSIGSHGGMFTRKAPYGISITLMSSAPDRFLVAVDDRVSSMDALREAVRLRHADTHLSVVNFVKFDEDPVEVPDTPSRALTERFELYLTPRIASSHWEISQVRERTPCLRSRDRRAG
jgi:hypothetical protein